MSKRSLLFLIPLIALSALLFFGSSAQIQAQTAAATTQPATAAPADNLVGLPSVAPVVKKSQDAVVNIFTVKVIKSDGSSRFGRRMPRGFEGMPNDDFFDYFFGFPVQPNRDYKERALGSGFIFDPEGYIITNNHVVEGADDINVKFSDGSEISANIIGRDPKTDLALIKLTKPGPYPYISLGDSDKVNIGDWLVAIGNPFGLEHTVTAGILSARGRAIGVGPYDDFLQTDASINPGNSGGPLLNLKGEVVGINTIIISGGTGIGFAIPSKVATKIIDQLKTTGRVDRGWIGVLIQQLTPEMTKSLGLEENLQGALVGSVVEDSPAAKGGVKHGDVITTFDGKTIKTIQDLTTIVADTTINKTVDVVVIRESKPLTLKITVGQLEDEESGSSSPTSSEIDLGLTLRELTPETASRLGLEDTKGLIVEKISPSSIAADAGVQAEDII
ncbi:MAG: Do family serine endopeptidase, partial [Deltaproteobacteria bacterium]|nr:Do family serine endopeptidase [Deltaproteobacteria bacterium]